MHLYTSLLLTGGAYLAFAKSVEPPTIERQPVTTHPASELSSSSFITRASASPSASADFPYHCILMMPDDGDVEEHCLCDEKFLLPPTIGPEGNKNCQHSNPPALATATISLSSRRFTGHGPMVRSTHLPESVSPEDLASASARFFGLGPEVRPTDVSSLSEDYSATFSTTHRGLGGPAVRPTSLSKSTATVEAESTSIEAYGPTDATSSAGRSAMPILPRRGLL